MTDPAPERRLLVDADLEISVDGVDATVTGRGDQLTLHTDQPIRLWRALRRSGLPEALRRFDQHVDGADVVVPALTVEGPHGPIAGTGPVSGHDGVAARQTGTGVRWYRPQHLVPTAAVWEAAAIGLLISLAVLRHLRR